MVNPSSSSDLRASEQTLPIRLLCYSQAVRVRICGQDKRSPFLLRQEQRKFLEDRRAKSQADGLRRDLARPTAGVLPGLTVPLQGWGS